MTDAKQPQGSYYKAHPAPGSTGAFSRISLPDPSAIGVFDSGLGGLTVAKAIAQALPHESIVYFGDTKRCPYGPRDPFEVRQFVRQICSWFEKRDVKLIVMACNTATAAGLELAQREFSIPVLGVIVPGARAATAITRTRRVGVIGTVATIRSEAYVRAIHALDAGISVFQAPAQRFVEIVEEGWRVKDPNSANALNPEIVSIARNYLSCFEGTGIDTLVLGCTHFPVLAGPIGEVMGPEIALISSAEETARDVTETLIRRGQLARNDAHGTWQFATTSDDPADFAQLASRIIGTNVPVPERVSIAQLEALAREHERAIGLA